MNPQSILHRRIGLFTLAALLGLSPLLAGLVLRARERSGMAAPRRMVDKREVAVKPKLSAGPRLPKGCLLRLQEGRPELWSVLIEKGAQGERIVKPIKRLRPGRPDWILKGQAPAPAIRWPTEAVARKEMVLEATGYDPGPVDNTRGWVGTTKTGERARFGIVAVDPRIIPLGSLVYVEGYGPGLAADIGGAIKGRRIDLCFNTTREARSWGRRKTRVWLVDRLRPVKARQLRAAAS